MTKKIEWKNEKRKLSELIPWSRNPRQISEKEAKRLNESFEIFNQVETIAIGPKNQVYNGHQRLNVWINKYGPDLEIDVRVSNRNLTEKEREKLVIFLHKGAIGEWDMDILANEFDITDLLDWGFKPYELGIIGDGNNLENIWKGMPEFIQEEKEGLVLIVHFANKNFRQIFAELIDQNITDMTKSIWYPERPEELKNQQGTGFVYTNES